MCVFSLRLVGNDFAEHRPFFRDVIPQERRNVGLGNGVKGLYEAEGVIPVEIPLRQGNSNILERIQSLNVGAKRCAADSLIEVLIDASRASRAASFLISAATVRASRLSPPA